MTATALVGRAHPLTVVRECVGRAVAGHGGVVLVTGEAGIGKTALVAVALAGLGSRPARGSAPLVLTGVCWDHESAPGYWPWSQVVRALRRDLPRNAWERAAEAAGGGLAFALDEAASADGADDRHATGDAGLRVQDAVASLLVAAAHERPLIVVIEDLHWADPASVRLLAYLASQVPFERILLVVTYRDVEVEAPGHPLGPLVAPLVAKATTVTLTGLEPPEVALLMHRVTGRQPRPEQAAEVRRRTGGNPFFVEQTARLWHTLGGTAADSEDGVGAGAGTSRQAGQATEIVPPGVRDAVRRRLAHLSPAVESLLRAAAVLGREFSLGLLAEVAGSPPAGSEQLLLDAVIARLVVSAGDGRFAFAHDIVRETLYATLDDAERRRRHAAAVRALERQAAAGRDVLRATLARHASSAVPEIPAAEAAAHLVAAARDASARLAAEEACRHYRAALDLLAEPDASADPGSTDIALALGTELERAGDIPGARATLHGVLDAARKQDDARLFARAAVSAYKLGNPTGTGRDEADLLDEAAERLTGHREQESALLARVLAASSMARTHQALEPDVAADRSAQALELARRSGDFTALVRSLLARHDARWEPGTARERLALLDEMATVARRAGDGEFLAQASSLRTLALLEEGDPQAWHEHAAYVAAAERLSLPRPRWFALIRASAMATLGGRFAETDRLLPEMAALGERLGEADVHRVRRDLAWELALARGQFGELDGILHARGHDAAPWVRVLAAVGALEAGDTGSACDFREDIARAQAVTPPRFAPMWLRYEAQMAALSGRAELRAAARARLAPLVGGWLIVSGLPVVCGPVVYWTAELDAAEGHFDHAVAGFTAAREAADNLGARPWAVRAAVRIAELLHNHPEGSGAARVVALAEAAERDAAALGMPHLAERCRALRGAEGIGTVTGVGSVSGVDSRSGEVSSDVHSEAAHTAARAPVPPAAPNVFRRDGKVWTLSYAGRTVHLPDAKGLRDLSTLLARPGTDIPAAELLDPAGGAETAAAAGSMGADAVLDDAAKSAYRRHLARLDEEIDSAVIRHDDHRAARLDTERTALIDELRRATGLAGRPRRLGDITERARQAVTARIRHSLRRLRDHHPALADHLQASVTTGTHCRYQPPEPTPWEFDPRA